MLATMKMMRSGGVPVTGPVHRLIANGNTARDLNAWPEAAEAYAAALERAPELFHIWIQRGHALKESGNLAEASVCYERARALCPENSDPHLHLGHAAKLRGDMPGATRHYFDAARCVPPAIDAIAELRSLTLKGATFDMHQFRDIIEQPGSTTVFEGLADNQRPHPEPEQDFADTDGVGSRTCVVFDVSDLISYFNHARTPSGIQRVQLETLREALNDGARDVRVCAVHETREEWIEIPPAQFLDLCHLSRHGTEAEWALTFARVTVRLSVEPPFVFPRGALLVNLGTSWWIPNYFMYVRRAKQEAGIRYIPFVHDLIPLVRSDLCPPLLVRDFMAWTVSVLDHADFYLVNSLSTRNDLMKISTYLGRSIQAERIEVVRLDAVPAKRDLRATDRGALARVGLQREPYVLFVSTIEPRKNHILAFEAWSKLIDRHGAKRVPKLVCVGNSGWMNEPIHGHLKARPDLEAKVLILSNVSDEELDQLYDGCLFTLYPSHYEGWGLPVTESLSHGKVALCSRISSIPEAGGDLADYFSPDSRAELIETIGKLAFDASYRRSRERQIARDFKPRSWHEIAEQILNSASQWIGMDAPVDAEPPQAALGRYCSFSRTLAPRLWPGLRSTETFRFGTNWWGRDPWGCWTKAGGGALRFLVPDATKAHRVYLELLGMPNVRCELRIDANGREGLQEMALEPNEGKWVPVELPGQDAHDLPITIDLACGTFEDLRKTGNSGDTRTIAVGVRGFYICESDDADARMAFLEAVSLSSIDTLSANRPPADFLSLQAFLERAVLD
ncbi:glycosyltransferase [Sphingomonas sp. QA11]|uniref:glycosyltransferase n=1 Tax=Sphingomonas sp. QA11 TaxID=2950605 RepID=UPI002349FAB4|nr:glycosyltransferase [Sphingomonas sp. QA11]WCM28050.1 glycosyltransferase [Sphingomonas sp. QA11]